MQSTVDELNSNRSVLIDSLLSIPAIGRILGGNSANFVLAEILDGERDKGGKACNKRALSVYKTMAESKGVVVRFRGSEKGCEGCLRVTVGSKEECEEVVKQLKALLV